MSRDDDYLLDMLDAAREARQFVSDLDEGGFLASRLHQNAVIRALEVLGEAAAQISDDTRRSNSDIAWKRIVGLRNVLLHQYRRVDLGQVWETVRDYLPALILRLEAIVPREDDA